MSPSGSKNAPEAKAREKIDVLLVQAGWLVQDREDMNLTAGDGIAVREFKLEKGHGYVDYLLFVGGDALGVVEAKPAGYSFTSVEAQAKKYVQGLPKSLSTPVKPLPFAYISTGDETVFINTLDPHARSRPVFTFHRPETLREWVSADTLDAWIKQSGGFFTKAEDSKPSTLRARLRAMPPVDLPGLWPNKVQAIAQLEKSLFDDRPRALIQMATGTGKTLLAVTEIYRLIKFGGARRVLFLVDRANLGEQAEKEFQGFRTPDDNRKFNELYNVQRLTSNTVGSSSKVVIKPGAKEPWTKKVWIYDFRTNKEFTLKERRMVRADLDEFVKCYHPENRHQRKPTWDEKKNTEGRWRPFTYDEIVARDKCSLDIFWLKDESLEDSANLPDPHVLAAEIAEDLRSALEQIESVLSDLQQRAAVVNRK